MSIGRSSRSSQNGPLVSIVPVSFRKRILAIFMDFLCSLGRHVKWALCQSVPPVGLSYRPMLEECPPREEEFGTARLWSEKQSQPGHTCVADRLSLFRLSSLSCQSFGPQPF